jgi:hypothetical protein
MSYRESSKGALYLTMAFQTPGVLPPPLLEDQHLPIEEVFLRTIPASIVS